jgi:hypothetical protein
LAALQLRFQLLNLRLTLLQLGFTNLQLATRVAQSIANRLQLAGSSLDYALNNRDVKPLAYFKRSFSFKPSWQPAQLQFLLWLPLDQPVIERETITIRSLSKERRESILYGHLSTAQAELKRASLDLLLLQVSSVSLYHTD